MCNIIITTTGKVVKIQGGKLKMKKFLAIALALVFVLGLAACSDSKTPKGGDSTEKGEVSVFYLSLIHIFSENARKTYNLEKLYQDTDEVDISGIVTDN